MPDVETRRRLAVAVCPETDHILGPSTAAVTVVEYGDYECVYCGAAHCVIKHLQRQMGADLRFVFRNFPVSPRHHPHAQQAAEAAEAAAAQGHFWEMHDQLFEHQDQLDLQHLRVYARAIGLDLKQFESDVVNRSYEQKVKDDFWGGVRSRVRGTPIFFINGVRYDGPQDLNSMLEAVRTADARAA
jgi:protein-disulfide isomerase